MTHMSSCLERLHFMEYELIRVVMWNMIKQVMVNSSAGTSCSDQNLFRRLVLDNQKGFVGNQWHPAPIKNDSSPTAVAATGKCKSIPAIFFFTFFFLQRLGFCEPFYWAGIAQRSAWPNPRQTWHANGARRWHYVGFYAGVSWDGCLMKTFRAPPAADFKSDDNQFAESSGVRSFSSCAS